MFIFKNYIFSFEVADVIHFGVLLAYFIIEDILGLNAAIMFFHF